MKMKNLLLTIATLVSIQLVDAQQYSIPFKNSDKQSIKITMKKSNVKIIGSGGNDVKIMVVDGKYQPSNSHAMKDSTGIDLNIRLEGQTLVIKKISEADKSYVISVPNGISLYYEEEFREPKQLEIDSMTGNLEIRTWVSKMMLVDNAGPITASSEAADIFVSYTNAATIKQGCFISQGRLVDIKLPEKVKADISADVIAGRFHSDFNDKITKSESNSEQHIDCKLNGGGPKLYIKAHTVQLHK
jgi:hypothetical protein